MLSQAVHNFYQHQGERKTYLIAYSGGLDSHVLLRLCRQLRKTLPLKLRAIHIHHGLSANADLWAAHCARVCQEYEIDFAVKTIHFEKNGSDSIEALAREQRYQAFAEYLQKDEILLTAHHQDDQAETVLLQLSRGAGIKGLAAMPVIKPFACGWHGRPLLSFQRVALQRYAELEQLTWIEDESNQNINLTRNFFRHHILYPLKERWPTIAATLSRTAMHCAEANQLLDEFAHLLLSTVAGGKANTLSVTKLLRLSSEKQKLLLRAWIAKLGFPALNTKKIEQVQETILKAGRDRIPRIAWANVVLRRFKDDLYLVRCLPVKIEQSFLWDLSSALHLSPLGKLQVQKTLATGFSEAIGEVRVQFRQGGEKANIKDRGRHTLKNLFQEWGVPTWERDYIPLIFKGEKLIGAVGYFTDPDFTASTNEWGMTLRWERVE